MKWDAKNLSSTTVCGWSNDDAIKKMVRVYDNDNITIAKRLNVRFSLSEVEEKMRRRNLLPISYTIIFYGSLPAPEPSIDCSFLLTKEGAVDEFKVMLGSNCLIHAVIE